LNCPVGSGFGYYGGNPGYPNEFPAWRPLTRAKPAFYLEVVVNWFRLKACAKCEGDLVLDDGDWLCLQCGRYYYTGLYRNQAQAPHSSEEIGRWPPENRPAPQTEKTRALAQSTSGPLKFGRAPTAPRSIHHLQRAAYADLVVRFSATAATR
jgi:hypothetical protein